MNTKRLAALKEVAERLAAGQRVEPGKLRAFGNAIVALIAEVERADQQAHEARVDRRASYLGISPGPRAAEQVRRFEEAKTALKQRGVRVSGPKGPNKIFILDGGGFDGHLLNVWEVIKAGGKG